MMLMMVIVVGIAAVDVDGDALKAALERVSDREAQCRIANSYADAKGVGYVTAKVQDCGMCWAGAFPNVTACADTKMQMRRLDRLREGMLCKVWNAIRSCGTLPERRSRGDRTTRRYKGRPFSYFGFLEKAVRPTNMSVRHVRTRALPYSEM